VFAEGDNARLLKGCQTVREALACHLGRLQPGDYVAFCAFIDMSPENDRVLRSLRGRLRDRTRAPTTLGFGPRFLHSTGQLHKGGPDSGLFIQVTADDSVDAAIPGKSMSFGVLKSAQAMGDYLALNARNRRLIRIHLKSETGSELEHLASALV
jgi:transaldolase/glucose-6-phosphate isomerase